MVCYFNLWFAELVFLAGVILLSSLYYKDRRTIVFVSVTLLGIAVWHPQIWWNFKIFYFVPFVLYCLHQCLITRRFRYLVFLILLFTLSVYGIFMYPAVFTSFVLLMYVVLLFICNPSLITNGKAFLKTYFTVRNTVILLMLLATIALSFSYILIGKRELAYLNSTRESSGSVSLKAFLSYGGATGFGKYKELFLRYGESLDINLYAGFLLFPLVLLALFYERSHDVPHPSRLRFVCTDEHRDYQARRMMYIVEKFLLL